VGGLAEGPATAETVNDYFRRWTDDGTLDRLHHALYAEWRDLAEREASPFAAIMGRKKLWGERREVWHHRRWIESDG
jgi:transposase